MPTVYDVCQLLQAGNWAICLDLKDAYFHTPVQRRHRHFLKFRWKGNDYHFRAENLLVGALSPINYKGLYQG